MLLWKKAEKTGIFRDRGSTNGTFLDGLRLEEGEKKKLLDGAEISFSGQAFLFSFRQHRNGTVSEKLKCLEMKRMDELRDFLRSRGKITSDAGGGQHSDLFCDGLSEAIRKMELTCWRTERLMGR